MTTETWSSRIAFYFVSIGAAVGLGTLWRFPYLAGQHGGAFLIVFIVACAVITTPIVAAEFLLGRRGRGSPPAATRAVATMVGRTPSWAAIGWLGTLAMFVIMTYYSVIGGWVLAYVGDFAAGGLRGLDAAGVGTRFAAFLADPWALAFWHLLFMALAVAISAAGLERGIELANKIMIPGLFALLIALVCYSFAAGDLARGVAFIFRADWSQLDASVVLAAVGQAFYATGVGMGIMLAYGAYVPREVSLLRGLRLFYTAGLCRAEFCDCGNRTRGRGTARAPEMVARPRSDGRGSSNVVCRTCDGAVFQSLVRRASAYRRADVR